MTTKTTTINIIRAADYSFDTHRNLAEQVATECAANGYAVVERNDGTQFLIRGYEAHIVNGQPCDCCSQTPGDWYEGEALHGTIATESDTFEKGQGSRVTIHRDRNGEAELSWSSGKGSASVTVFLLNLMDELRVIANLD